MKTSLWWVAVFSSIVAQAPGAPDKEPLRRELMRTESEFFHYALDHGFNEAMHAYMAPDGFIANSLTLGRDVIAQRLAADTSAKLHANVIRWRPLRADIAESGDLGYTWGVAESGPAKEGPFKPYGIYVTIWQRQPDGKWKFVYDASTNLAAERIDAFVREHFPAAAPVGPGEKPIEAAARK
jgi:ketosteroid isomerase-like protein